ncbi:MAG: poly[(R)-3-hydroxyalkanoate] polymerase subunit PhaC [Mycobacterium sp.]
MVATNSAAEDELAAPLDLLLTSSAVGIAERVMPNVSWSRCALNLARQPRTATSRAASLGRELVTIAAGRSDVAPARGDKRFTDPAWRGNPLVKRPMHAYLATNTTVEQLFSDAHLDWRDAERIRFVLDVVTVNGTAAHGYLTPSLAPVVISEMSQIRAVTSALNDGLNKVRFPSPLPVDAPIRATVTVMSAQQKTSGVESVFELTYEIDGEKRPACVASVIVLYA